MAAFKDSYEIVVNYHIDSVYNLLCDLKKYKKILPNIKELKILNCTNDIIFAHIKLGHLLITLQYDCEIKFIKELHRIEINGYGGSFKYINAFWELTQISDTCTRVKYHIEFELKSRLHQVAAKQIIKFESGRIKQSLLLALSDL